MKISLNWLKEFVDVEAEPRKFKSDLTRVGLNVEVFAAVGDDFVFDVEVTTNRPDCLSHYGVAREVATLNCKPLRRREISMKESGAPASKEISIEIADPDLCARYCGRVIQSVGVKPSPAWLARRLEAVGVRPINNVADVTNYVLMELGHPLHAFDLARLRQKKIIVRRARGGERLKTLDGVERQLKPENLVIADGERAVALAGVMGGEESEITPATRAVLLESAWFDPASIRRTAKMHGLHTEASHRFERGADIEMAPAALDLAAAHIAELAGGTVLPGIVDVFPRPRPRAEITLRSNSILRLLGADITGVEVERLLRSLGFTVAREGNGEWRAVAPSWRLDVRREVDLIEEVARHFGYDRLPARLRPAPPRLERDTRREKELAITATLVALGYREIIPPSMVDPEENARFTDRPPVALANPLSQQESALRSSSIPSMLRALRWNLDRGQADLRLFELGRTYTARTGDLPEERRALTLGLSGCRRPARMNEQVEELDFFDLKGHLEALFAVFEARGLGFEAKGSNYYEPGLGGRWLYGPEALAVAGQLAQDLRREQKLRQDVWLAEVDLDRLLGLPLQAPAYRPYSKFPAVERDFSLLVPEGTLYSRLAGAILDARLEEVQRFAPVDRLPGGKIAAGHYSLLLRVTFQSRSRTLTSDDINEASRQLLAALETLKVRVRT